MKDSVFENNMDLQKYIEKRLLEVSDFDQRRQLRETLNNVFLNLYGYIEGEYQNLEQRILQEEEICNHYLSVHTSIVPRNLFDATDEYLVPMDSGDVEKPEIDMNELTECIAKKQKYPLYRVILEADYQVVKALAKEKRKFKGVVITDQGRFDGEFTVSKDDYYLRMVERLYPVFVNNHLPWNTICAPYLNKVFQVSLHSVENWDKDAEIKEIQVDFEEYAKFVRYDCIPVWNLSIQSEKSSSYPEPCMDHIHYQHVIYRHRLDNDTNYLIASTEFPLQNVKRVEGDLFITCGEEYPVKWLLYKLGKPSNRNYPYPIFTNQVREDFSDALYQRYQTSVKTESELKRFIESLGYLDILKFKGYRFAELPLDESESYHLDYFIEDEFRTPGNRMTMVLLFEAERADNFLNRDIMSYLATQVQKRFPEYQCIGQMS